MVRSEKGRSESLSLSLSSSVAAYVVACLLSVFSWIVRRSFVRLNRLCRVMNGAKKCFTLFLSSGHTPL